MWGCGPSSSLASCSTEHCRRTATAAEDVLATSAGAVGFWTISLAWGVVVSLPHTPPRASPRQRGLRSAECPISPAWPLRGRPAPRDGGGRAEVKFKSDAATRGSLATWASGRSRSTLTGWATCCCGRACSSTRPPYWRAVRRRGPRRARLLLFMVALYGQATGVGNAPQLAEARTAPILASRRTCETPLVVPSTGHVLWWLTRYGTVVFYLTSCAVLCTPRSTENVKLPKRERRRDPDEVIGLVHPRMLGLLAPNAYAPVARLPSACAVPGGMLTRREMATSAGAALLAMGAFSGEANAALTAEFRKADQSKIGVSTVESAQPPLRTHTVLAPFPLVLGKLLEASKITSPCVAVPTTSATNGTRPSRARRHLRLGQCESPLACWSKYPGQNLVDGTRGIARSAHRREDPNPAEVPLSPFGINAGLGESYTAQKRGSSLLPPPTAEARLRPPPAAERLSSVVRARLVDPWYPRAAGSWFGLFSF